MLIVLLRYHPFLVIATMSEKPSHERVSRDLDNSPARKTSISQTIASHKGKSKAEEIARIDRLATAPGVTLESFAHLDEKKILRKMDLHLIPMLALLYLLSFLDRGNIGNAKIEGLTETLGMSGAQYNWCLTVFFFTYVSLRDYGWYISSANEVQIRSLRGTQQSTFEAPQAVHLAADNHGGLGHRHDAHGHCPELSWASGCTHFPWCNGSWIVSRYDGFPSLS